MREEKQVISCQAKCIINCTEVCLLQIEEHILTSQLSCPRVRLFWISCMRSRENPKWSCRDVEVYQTDFMILHHSWVKIFITLTDNWCIYVPKVLSLTITLSEKGWRQAEFCLSLFGYYPWNLCDFKSFSVWKLKFPGLQSRNLLTFVPERHKCETYHNEKLKCTKVIAETKRGLYDLSNFLAQN